MDVLNYVIDNLSEIDYTTVVDAISLFYIKKNNMSLITTSIPGAKDFVESDLSYDDIKPIEDKLIHEIKNFYHLYEEPVLISRKNKYIDPYLQKNATKFFFKISNQKNYWNPCDVSRLLKLNKQYQLACDYDVAYVSMVLLLTNDNKITVENYLRYLI